MQSIKIIDQTDSKANIAETTYRGLAMKIAVVKIKSYIVFFVTFLIQHSRKKCISVKN